MIPISSDEYRDRKLRAKRWALIFWQGANGLNQPVTDLCPTATEYYERQYIKNLESDYICQLNEAIKYDTLLAALRAKSSDVATILTLLSYRYNPLNWVKNHATRKFTYDI